MSGKQLGTLVTYNPWSVGPTALLDDIAARFDELRVHHVPVVDGQRRVIGMLSETDLLRARQSRRALLVAAGGHDTDDAPAVFARDCMSRDVHSIGPTAEFAPALSLLLDRQIHALPVVESGRLVGMVTSRDFLREFSYGELPGSREIVSRLLSANPPQTLSPSTTLDQALLAMHESGASCLPVAEGNRAVGVASQRDIVREKCRLEDQADEPTYGQPGCRPATTIVQAMRHSPAIGSGQRLFEAAAPMVEHELPAVTIVNQSNQLLGLITEDDLLRALYDAQA
jgi:CBS domain-containing protein